MDGKSALALSKNYTNMVALGIGNMRVEDTTVYFTIAQTGEEVSVTLPTPKDGVSIETVEIDENNHIICTMSDGTTVDAGELPSYEPVLTEALSPNVTMGSLKTSYPVGTSLEEIIRDMLTEKVPPAVSVTINPSKTLYDIVSESISSLTINATVTKKTNNVSKVEFYVDDVLVHTTTSGVASGGSFPYIYNTEIKDTVVIKVKVTDTEGLSSVATKKIEFVGRSYYGYIEPDVEVTESVIKTLQNNTLQTTKALTYEDITCTYHRVVYCYDKELGELSSIVDPINNFSYTNSFEKRTITVDGIEKWCYILIQPTGADEVTIRCS